MMALHHRRISLTIKHAAEALDVAEPTVWGLIRSVPLETFTIGRRRLIYWDSIEKLVESRRGVPGDARRNGTVPALGAKKKGRKELDLATPIEGLELSTRSKNALVNQGVKTVDQLVPQTAEELLALPNLGKTSLAEIKTLLKKHGLHLGMELQEPDLAPSPPARDRQTRRR
jgi:Bacterial RNA polymerase, alpha chain C terminal domain/Helix-turn-helix domain